VKYSAGTYLDCAAGTMGASVCDLFVSLSLTSYSCLHLHLHSHHLPPSLSLIPLLYSCTRIYCILSDIRVRLQDGSIVLDERSFDPPVSSAAGASTVSTAATAVGTAGDASSAAADKAAKPVLLAAQDLICGHLVNFNTLERFKACDKLALLQQVCVSPSSAGRRGVYCVRVLCIVYCVCVLCVCIVCHVFLSNHPLLPFPRWDTQCGPTSLLVRL